MPTMRRANRDVAAFHRRLRRDAQTTISAYSACRAAIRRERSQALGRACSEMQSNFADAHRDWDRDVAAQCVGAVGSCHGRPGGKAAGWGVYWGSQDIRHAKRALPGHKQSAGRADVWAAVQAIMQAATPIYIATDSTEVYSKGNPIKSGRVPTGRHADIWSRVIPSRDKLRGVYWVKAHLVADEAIARAEAGGYPSWSVPSSLSDHGAVHTGGPSLESGAAARLRPILALLGESLARRRPGRACDSN